MSFTEKTFQSQNSQGTHQIVYNDWGPEDGEPAICVPGLTGNAHDFDYLARELVRQNRRLIAVDLPGRGRSDFLTNPLDYNYKQYCHDLMGLMNELGFNKPGAVDWIGISLGGLLGIKLAGMEDTPIRRLILNDVGPIVPKPALDFIHSVISQKYSFDTVKDLEKRMRETRGLTWGPLDDGQWKHMAEHNARALDDGSITYSYDSGIAVIFEHEPIGDSDLREYWKEIKCPVLLIHGKKSVVLTKPIIEEMEISYTGPNMHYIQYKDCGHVPSLMVQHQIDDIKTWLDETPI